MTSPPHLYPVTTTGPRRGGAAPARPAAGGRRRRLPRPGRLRPAGAQAVGGLTVYDLARPASS